VDEEVVLSWISARSFNLRHYTSEAELCQARDLQTCLPFVFSFFFLHLIIDSHPIPKPLVEGLFLYFWFLYFDDKEAGYANQVQFIVPLTKVIRGFMGYGRTDG
jgi:hypothetical protein